MMERTIRGQLVDIPNREIYAAEVNLKNGSVHSIRRLATAETEKELPFLLPGFIDAHVHIESSMLVPAEFARLAVVHGTVATVSDPHEIANVCGIAGVDFMLENGRQVPFKFNFGAPSCVPATIFETAGATLDADDVTGLLSRKEIRYLSEMMNFPGVLHGDPEVLKKIEAAKKMNKPVDGHAPGLTGEDARKYIAAGISTDHECFTREEAMGKLRHGMKILIREGSAAKNFDALIDLLKDYPDEMMFCSDDKHPDSLAAGHINLLCKRAVEKGIPVFHILSAACINPVLHYGLEAGLLREGDAADMILVGDLKSFHVIETIINGETVSEDGVSLLKPAKSRLINNFNCPEIHIGSLSVNAGNRKTIPVIEALDGQLITNRLQVPLSDFLLNSRNDLLPNPEKDLLKLVVVNRYKPAKPAVAFIRNFGLIKGAIASSVAHDSHNLIAVGTNDEDLVTAINLVIRSKGGISAAEKEEQMLLPLPVAGLMSDGDGYTIADAYTRIDAKAKAMGSKLSAPFMTLSFMALLVIPHLKLSDRGLFDGDGFRFLA